MYRSLDFLYFPCADVDAGVAEHVALGWELRFKIRAFDTTVACLRSASEGPSVLLAGHLEDGPPVLVHRVEDYAAAVGELRSRGVAGLHEFEIPHGPCAAFETSSGQRIAVYELTRPQANTRFEGRLDP